MNAESIHSDALPLPTATVVIPTRQRVESLKRCLQTLVPYLSAHPECALVVSDDGDAEVTRGQLEIEIPSVQVLQGPRRGPAANRNYGAAHARTELLIFLDDDCIPQPDCIEKYRTAARNHAEVGVFEGAIRPEGELTSFADSSPVNLTGGHLWSCNMCVRTPVFREIGGFDERFPFAAMEDMDFHHRVRSVAKIVFLPDTTVTHPYERRLGWKVVKHHTLSVLLFLHLHGARATGRTSFFFIKQGILGLRRGFRRFTNGTGKDVSQLLFQTVESLEIALIIILWKSRARLVRGMLPPCCEGCRAIHQKLIDDHEPKADMTSRNASTA